ncbi:MAG: class II glutamine amidotransferase [Polyangiaceae bacterium]|nr:class II glutamine amidotransferase [Polyangiaceae bacterium]
MARLLGFIANRPDLGSRAVALESKAFTVRVSEPPAGAAPSPSPRESNPTLEGSVSWGVGFYQGGEILLKRRPFDERRALGFPDLVKDIRADVLIGHIRTATVGALRTENTHPFRYRQWLFAQTGTVPHFDRLRGRVLEQLPQFLARDVRGETDAELVFYLFLSFLHDMNKLDRADVAAGTVRDALRSTLSLVERLCAEETKDRVALNMVVGCADYIVGTRLSNPMGFHMMAGRAALERIFGGESFSRTKIPHLMSARIALLAADLDDDRLPAGWTALEDRTTVTLSHSDDPHVERL